VYGTPLKQPFKVSSSQNKSVNVFISNPELFFTRSENQLFSSFFLALQSSNFSSKRNVFFSKKFTPPPPKK
jgi:hypothetical protein